jgi:hypothetical protein
MKTLTRVLIGMTSTTLVTLACGTHGPAASAKEIAGDLPLVLVNRTQQPIEAVSIELVDDPEVTYAPLDTSRQSGSAIAPGDSRQIATLHANDYAISLKADGGRKHGGVHFKMKGATEIVLYGPPNGIPMDAVTPGFTRLVLSSSIDRKPPAGAVTKSQCEGDIPSAHVKP